jgi:hypothetical protein
MYREDTACGDAVDVMPDEQQDGLGVEVGCCCITDPAPHLVQLLLRLEDHEVNQHEPTGAFGAFSPADPPLGPQGSAADFVAC